MKVGDYVRTKDGNIGKIEDIEVYDYEIEDGSVIEKELIKYCIAQTKTYYKSDSCYEEDVYKSSPNIIDLIEIGDYVNGCLIIEITKDPFIKGQINLWTNMILSEGEPFPNEYFKEKIIEKDIKSIVTKEQFESMEYKVEEKE